MKLLTRVLPLAACAVVGCAKFPADGANTSFTKVTFRMRVEGTINQNYIYDVAIRASTDPNPTTDPNRVPQPVINANNPNGRVAGSPTHFVEYAPTNPQSIDPFVLWRFSTQEEVPNESDPDNPINLASFAPSTRGRIVNFQQVTPGTSKELVFEVFLNLLGDTDEQARQIQALQVQFLTMNRLSTQGAGTRIYDYLGALNQPEFIKVDLRSNNTYGNTGNLPGTGVEPDNDCPDPDLNIVDWSIEVQRQ